ncbi:MAG: hypothetical protein BWK75_02330 [Candidatus Altiarchaeales archaeon A3]|nr:MAG: hypothetical protein BWK75_02330 [Candidatus Altiarchaeales archaeon A3]
MNFREHFLFGVCIGIAFSVVFLFYEEFSLLIFLPLLLAILGSVLPDIDHHASIPFRTLKGIIFLFFFLSSLALIIEYSEILNQITESFSAIFPVNVSSEIIKFFIVILIAITVGILSVIMLKIIKPAHRGITHKKTTGIFIGFLLFLFFYFLVQNQNFSVITAISFIIGFFSHLALDKILFKM